MITTEIDRLVFEVRRIKHLARPTTAVILDVLDAIGGDELQRLSTARDVSIQDVTTLAERLHRHPRVIADVLTRFVRLDLADYTSRYSRYKHLYETSSFPQVEVTRMLEGKFRVNALYCVLHDGLYRWLYDEKEFADIIIEDDQAYLLIKGFLVSTGLAFGSTVSLLCASYDSLWPNWQSLWRYF